VLKQITAEQVIARAREMVTCAPRLIWFGLATVLAVVTYFYGLDSAHIPKNGTSLPTSTSRA